MTCSASLTCAVLVFLMQPGFLCLEAGLTRSKNSIHVALKNLTDFAVSVLTFSLLGYALLFGTSFEGLVGRIGFFPEVASDPKAAAFLLQLGFCGTAVTITSGAVAERRRFGAYVVVVSGFGPPIRRTVGHWVGHWAWNGVSPGNPQGWLARLGFVDFAGSTVVHSLGGWASLAIA